MTVKLELKPEVEASLGGQARARGIPLADYLQSAIEDLARAGQASIRGADRLRKDARSLSSNGTQPSAAALCCINPREHVSGSRLSKLCSSLPIPTFFSGYSSLETPNTAM